MFQVHYYSSNHVSYFQNYKPLLSPATHTVMQLIFGVFTGLQALCRKYTYWQVKPIPVLSVFFFLNVTCASHIRCASLSRDYGIDLSYIFLYLKASWQLSTKHNFLWSMDAEKSSPWGRKNWFEASFSLYILRTSAVGKREIPCSSTRWSGEAGQGGMTLQHIALAAAVANFVPDVERGPLLVAVEQLSRITTSVTGQSWRKREGTERGHHASCLYFGEGENERRALEVPGDGDYSHSAICLWQHIWPWERLLLLIHQNKLFSLPQKCWYRIKWICYW